MSLQSHSRRVYIETIHPLSVEALSLHLARHLPRRATLGHVIIVHSRPSIFLAVLRKRWMQLAREIERERSRTLDHTKRVFLGQELEQMLRFKFSSKPTTPGSVLVASWQDILRSRLNCFTLYVITPLSEQEVAQSLSFVATGGLMVRYIVEPATGPTWQPASPQH